MEENLRQPPRLFVTKPRADQAGDVDLDGHTGMVLRPDAIDNDHSRIVGLRNAGCWERPDWIAHDISGMERIEFDLYRFSSVK